MLVYLRDRVLIIFVRIVSLQIYFCTCPGVSLLWLLEREFCCYRIVNNNTNTNVTI